MADAVIAYLDKTIEIPNVSAQKVSRELVGERSRTAGGLMRQDLVALKRQWRLECVFLTPTQYMNIMSKLQGSSWVHLPFWLDEFGGTAQNNSIQAFVSVDEDERAQFRGDDGSWVNQGRRLVLTVMER